MSQPGHVQATGIGSWPGTDVVETTKIVFATSPELPYLPELPARGPHAAVIGRGTALLTGLGVEVQAGRWRLGDTSGRDHRRAISLLRADLDVLEEQAQDHHGPIKIGFAGPWTLAAELEHPRGDKVLGDRGARRDLVQSLTQGLTDLTQELGRRLPAAELVVQLDEPWLPGVLAGGVATASGLHRHRAVDLPEVSGAYEGIVAALTSAASGRSVPIWVHSCAGAVPVGLLHRAGVAAVLLDLDLVEPKAWDAIGAAMEEGLVLGLGAQPTTGVLSADRVAERALAALRPLELDPATTLTTLLTPACGLAGLTATGALAAVRAVATAADIVTDQLAA